MHCVFNFIWLAGIVNTSLYKTNPILRGLSHVKLSSFSTFSMHCTFYTYIWQLVYIWGQYALCKVFMIRLNTYSESLPFLEYWQKSLKFHQWWGHLRSWCSVVILGTMFCRWRLVFHSHLLYLTSCMEETYERSHIMSKYPLQIAQSLCFQKLITYLLVALQSAFTISKRIHGISYALLHFIYSSKLWTGPACDLKQEQYIMV